MKVSSKARTGQMESELVSAFQKNGYLRFPDPDRRKLETRNYKKGFEIRIVVESKSGVAPLARLCRQLELKPGKPYSKGERWVLPIYGREAVERFQKWIQKRDGSRRR